MSQRTLSFPLAPLLIPHLQELTLTLIALHHNPDTGTDTLVDKLYPRVSGDVFTDGGALRVSPRGRSWEAMIVGVQWSLFGSNMISNYSHGQCSKCKEGISN